MIRTSVLALFCTALVGCPQLKPNETGDDGGDVDRVGATPDAGDANDGTDDPEDAEAAAPVLPPDAPDAPDAADAPDAPDDALDGPKPPTDGEAGPGAPTVSCGVGADGTPKIDWAPRDLQGLALWLDAAAGVQVEGADVRAWVDQSSNHHRAIPPYPSLLPVLLAAGIGQHPAVDFPGNGAMLTIPDAPSLRFGSRNFVVEMVVRHSTPTIHLDCDTNTNYGALYVKSEADRPYRGLAMFANWEFWDATGSRGVYPLYGAQLDGFHFITTQDNVVYNDDRPRALAVERRDDVLSLRVNGVPITTGVVPLDDGGAMNIDALGAGVDIGAQLNRAQCLRGAIAEIVAVVDATVEETASLDCYLLHKYEGAIRRTSAPK